MITDREAVRAAAATYDPQTQPVIDILDHAIRVFVADASDGALNVAIEGTHNRPGWLLDFFAVAIADRARVDHPTFGPVEAGFYLAALAVLNRLALVIGSRPAHLIGHSLGAIEAIMLAQLLTDAGHQILDCFAFAPPRGGFDPFVAACAKLKLRAFRFHDDAVPLVPFTVPGLWPYRQFPLIGLGPSPGHYPSFSDHSVINYVTALSPQQAVA